jgi:hypothetical protein
MGGKEPFFFVILKIVKRQKRKIGVLWTLKSRKRKVRRGARRPVRHTRTMSR